MAASAGAIAVFGFGVLGVMGAAKGAAMLLGALPRLCVCLRFADRGSPGHSLDAKRPEAGSQDSAQARVGQQACRGLASSEHTCTAQSQSDAELRAELSALRALPRSKDTDARKAAVKKLLLRDA